ncbi:MAG: ABC transporter permease [Streptosporangiaceae bacterium]
MTAISATRPPRPLAQPTQPTRRTAFGKIVLNEARLNLRQPQGLIGGLAIPLVLLFVFNAIPTFKRPSADLGGLSAFGVYVPILIVFSLAMLALFNLPVPLASYRELGILRRLSTTPVPPSWLLAAQGVINVAVAAAATLILIGGGIALGAPAPRNPAGLTVALVLSLAALFPIGLLVASVARSANSASIIGRVLFFPLIFLAGLWWPRELMPGAMQAVSEASPLGAAVQAMQASVQGQFPPAVPLLVLAAYAVAFGYLAKRFFKWE